MALDFNIPPKIDDPQRVLALNGVLRKFYLNAEDINKLIVAISYILGTDTSLFKGEHNSIEGLTAAHPSPEPASYAHLIVEEGNNLFVFWNSANTVWEVGGPVVPFGNNLTQGYIDQQDASVLQAAMQHANNLISSGTFGLNAQQIIDALGYVPAEESNTIFAENTDTLPDEGQDGVIYQLIDPPIQLFWKGGEYQEASGLQIFFNEMNEMLNELGV